MRSTAGAVVTSLPSSSAMRTLEFFHQCHLCHLPYRPLHSFAQCLVGGIDEGLQARAPFNFKDALEQAKTELWSVNPKRVKEDLGCVFLPFAAH